jgi:hypothetical protein
MDILGLAVVAALGLLWLWMRSAIIRRGGWRLGAGLSAVALVVIGGAIAIRGEWYVGLPMVIGGLVSAAAGRMNRGRPADAREAPPQSRGPYRQGPPPRYPPSRRETMSVADACAILGVAPGASTAQIRAAYTRLMQRAHPDKGGTTGLAAQLNAARDRLLKG